MSGQEQGGLKRSITLFAVIALGINGIIGQGIFLLPGKAAALLGPASLLSLAFAGLLSFLIALCFAEVARCEASTKPDSLTLVIFAENMNKSSAQHPAALGVLV